MSRIRKTKQKKPRVHISIDQLGVISKMGLYSFEIEMITNFSLTENQKNFIDENIDMNTRRIKLIQLIPKKKNEIKYFYKYGQNVEKVMQRRLFIRLNLSISMHCQQNGHNPTSMNQQALELLLGYNLDKLATHIESQFTDAISWENMADWHIDHIIPKSLFKFESFYDKQFRECWKLENLRPLLAKENIEKSNKYIGQFDEKKVLNG